MSYEDNARHCLPGTVVVSTLVTVGPSSVDTLVTVTPIVGVSKSIAVVTIVLLEPPIVCVA